jgi:beta-mannosidase
MLRLDLDGRWELAWCEPGEGEEQGWPERGLPRDRRVQACVPGDVHLDLVEAGFIGEPTFGLNARDCVWMEAKDWWYSRTFVLLPGQIGDRVELHFAGLDTTADIWLNGRRAGSSNNAHVPHAFDVTGAVRPGLNLLVLRLDPGMRATEGKDLRSYQMHTSANDEQRMWIRKPQFAFGWDWAPRLVTCGIWRSVALCSYRGAALRDVCLRTGLLADGSAHVEVLADVESFAEAPLGVTVEVNVVRGQSHGARLEATVPPGSTELTGQVVVVEPDLWWPAPLGAPALYDVAATLHVGDEVVDSAAFRYGLREVALLREPLGEEEGTSFVVAVNGRQVFCKGADWVPPDSIPARAAPRKYGALIRAAAEANCNMLRIWGGGTFEDEAFYTLCDENGILVWQDFLFACSYYPDDDEEFVRAVREEAEKGVRRLRNHPCLAVWCGNNENQWIHCQRVRRGAAAGRCPGERLYDDVLPEVCARLDPTRPYWPGSPYGGDYPNSERAGDRHHWYVSIAAPTVEQKTDYTLYGGDRGKFISEYGVQAPPSLDSIRRYLRPEDVRRDSEAWQFHTNNFEQGMIAAALERYWRPADQLPLEDYVRYGQAIQAEVLRFSIEHWRRRKFRTAGVLFWMWADAWGEVGWTVIDYYLDRKRSYYAVKRAFAPLLVSLAQAEDGVEVWLVNDLLQPVQAELTFGWVNVAAGEVASRTEAVDIAANAAAPVQRMDLPDGPSGEWVAFARLAREGRAISANRLFLTGFRFSELALPQANVECTAAADAGAIELGSDAYAWQVHLDVPRGVRVEDNDFDMLPRERRVVRAVGPRDLVQRIAARALNGAAGSPPAGCMEGGIA